MPINLPVVLNSNLRDIVPVHIIAKKAARNVRKLVTSVKVSKR